VVPDGDLRAEDADYDKAVIKKISTWYEALSVPGSLRIDFTPIKDGNGILFTDEKITHSKMASRKACGLSFIRS